MELPLPAHRITAALAFTLLVFFVFISQAQDQIPRELRLWLESPQAWQRDTDGPIISLGKKGSFDDEHIFAPMVALENGKFTLWHCGSTGTVAERVFQLGMSTSTDGRNFTLNPQSPVFRFGKGLKSVLTPTLLRNPDGSTLRENGKLRMWFSATEFTDKSGLHTLHESTSEDGVTWAKPSPVLLAGVYAPSVIKIGEGYQMWYTDVSGNPWVIRQASSKDGFKWGVHPDPVIQLDQTWEKENQFYPTVIKIDDAYLMWYGSYWTERADTTALGFAVSLDGLKWYKHPQNPVYRPDPNRPWESNYTTSQSIMRLPDGSLRMWYASRKKPPFLNKYFAINTAVWKNPAAASPESNPSMNNLSEAEQHLGFSLLNDGSSFDGWKQAGNWEIQNGAFFRARKGGPLTYERSKVPDDFELRFEWKVSKGCNSGIYYRPSQYEYQILDNVHSPYGENPRQAAASLFFCMAPSKDASKPFGEWNTGRVVGKGSVIQHWLNGEKVIDFDYTDPKWAKEVELLRIRGADLAARNGNIWLQDHGQPVWFRNIRMRAIPADEKLVPDPNFQPMPIPPAALKKEQARVRSMLEKSKK